VARSYRKRPIMSIARASSEKEDKRRAHRRARRQTRQLVGMGLDETGLRDTKDYFDPWMAAKDGKTWFDPAERPRWMRK